VYISRQRQGRHGPFNRRGMDFPRTGKERPVPGVLPGQPQLLYVEKTAPCTSRRTAARRRKGRRPGAGFGDFFVSRHKPGLLLSARGKMVLPQPDGGKSWDKLRLSLSGPTKDAHLPMARCGFGPGGRHDPQQDNGENWESVWDHVGAMAPDPWDNNSLYMVTAAVDLVVQSEGSDAQEQLDIRPTPRSPPTWNSPGRMLVESL